MSRIDAVLMKTPVLNVFSSKKMIRNKVINLLGAQPFRIWLASNLYKLRPKHSTKEVSNYLADLEKDGIAIIPDFLPIELFEKLEKECMSALENEEPSRQFFSGNNDYSNIQISRLDSYPTISSVAKNGLIEKIFKGAERRNLSLSKITRLLTCLVQGEENGIQDPETQLHEDTFFNTHKAWLYITNVPLANAPFVYVKGSQKNGTVNRISKSYKYSLDKKNIHSRRISKEELQELKLSESIITAKKNTFVIANTLGFHRRMEGMSGGKRIALAFSARFNPFI